MRTYGQDLVSRWELAGFDAERRATNAGPGNEIIEARPRPPGESAR